MLLLVCWELGIAAWVTSGEREQTDQVWTVGCYDRVELGVIPPLWQSSREVGVVLQLHRGELDAEGGAAKVNEIRTTN